MLPVSLESILKAYQQLSDPDSQIRQQANLHLLTLIDHQQIWKITQKMITNQPAPEHQLLGAQILYQKLERDIDQLTQQQKQELKLFIFGQLTNQGLTLPTVRKLAGSASLIAASLYLDSWTNFVPDMVKFMDTSPLQLRNGMVVIQRFPQQLKATNRIKHGLKLQIRQDLLKHSNLLAQVFWSAIQLKQPLLTDLCLQSLQNWILIGFPLLSYPAMVNMLLTLANTHQDSLPACCKMFKQALRYNSQQKYQSVGDLEQVVERTTYSNEQNQSLNFITLYLQALTGGIVTSLKQGRNIENVENYSLVLKELLLSYNCLLKADIGYELVELMFRIVQSQDLKLSYSTFQFWLDFIEKISKLKVEPNIQEKFKRIVEHLFATLIQKVKIDYDTLVSTTLKDDDTLDDIQKINIEQYRKQATFVVKLCFDYFSNKEQMEGSMKFFRGLIVQIDKEKQGGKMIVGLQAGVWAVKAALESMVRPYDTQNIVKFIEYTMSEISSVILPPRVLSEVLKLIKDCNRQIKQHQTLFLNCLQFTLKGVSDANVSHYAVYAFHSLMQSVGQLSNDTLVQGLIEFYSKVHIPKETVLEKIVEGILTSITKLQNKEAMRHYLLRIVGGIQNKYKNVESSADDHSVYISLIEIKTLLNSFDEFKAEDKEQFRPIFMQIAIYGLSITTSIVQKYISNRIKFTTVGDLGAALSVLRSSLRLCQHCKVAEIPLQQYINLMQVVRTIFQQGLFTMFNSLTDIITRIFTQFIGENIPALHQWLTVSIPPIDSFFFAELGKHSIDKIDPDTLRYFFSLQQSILLYSQEHYLSQPQHLQIYKLAVSGLQRINQRQFQRKATTFIHNCLMLPQVYHSQKQQTLRSLFSSIPNINNICHITLSKILVILFQGVDVRGKENIVRQLLERQPYGQVGGGLKEIMAKFMAFAVDSKVERFIKGTINDLSDLRWKDMGQDAALHLELRFSKWKREFKSMGKEQ